MGGLFSGILKPLMTWIACYFLNPNIVKEFLGIFVRPVLILGCLRIGDWVSLFCFVFFFFPYLVIFSSFERLVYQIGS